MRNETKSHYNEAEQGETTEFRVSEESDEEGEEEKKEEFKFPEVLVEEEKEEEKGYVAKDATTSTKTDTPIIETPQSISVITRTS